jgi:cytochrome c
MKKVFLAVLTVGMLSLTSCGGEAKKGTDAIKEAATKTADAAKETATKAADVAKETAAKTADAVKEGANKVADAVNPKVAKGKALFAAKACTACHQEQTKVVGPSLKEIAKVYADKKGNMVKFLKEEADAIVDPAMFATMKANLAITKAMSGEELAALTAYIRSVK